VEEEVDPQAAQNLVPGCFSFPQDEQYIFFSTFA
jgi:hypothetical protein